LRLLERSSVSETYHSLGSVSLVTFIEMSEKDRVRAALEVLGRYRDYVIPWDRCGWVEFGSRVHLTVKGGST
jgi:hypothetical protein